MDHGLESIEVVMAPQKGEPKLVKAKDESKPPLATPRGKTAPINWTAFLEGISRGKTVLEYGANRQIFVQGDPADSLWYPNRHNFGIGISLPRNPPPSGRELNSGELHPDRIAGHTYLQILLEVFSYSPDQSWH
jgi:hypothetical protein